MELYQSIEHAVTCGSLCDIACALLAHPCCIQLPPEYLDPQLLTKSENLWNAVRFVAECEIAASRVCGGTDEQ